MSYGDSKTWLNGWQPALLAGLLSAGLSATANTNIAVNGATVASMKATVDADLLAATVVPDAILLNLGANDMAALPAEISWKADLTYIIDAFHAKWPWPLVYITSPWTRGHDADADTMAGWIAAVVATRQFARGGDDERAWLKGVDDGATMTSDGLHYSAAGNTEKAAQMKALLGY